MRHPHGCPFSPLCEYPIREYSIVPGEYLGEEQRAREVRDGVRRREDLEPALVPEAYSEYSLLGTPSTRAGRILSAAMGRSPGLQVPVGALSPQAVLTRVLRVLTGYSG